MALAMAREAHAPANDAGAQRCLVYASEEVHMSIPKAVALLGIGRDQLSFNALAGFVGGGAKWLRCRQFVSPMRDNAALPHARVPWRLGAEWRVDG
jgi:hypothetical protein